MLPYTTKGNEASRGIYIGCTLPKNKCINRKEAFVRHACRNHGSHLQCTHARSDLRANKEWTSMMEYIDNIDNT